MTVNKTIKKLVLHQINSQQQDLNRGMKVIFNRNVKYITYAKFIFKIH